MYTATTFGLAALLARSAYAHANVVEAALAARQTTNSEEAYITAVCYPNVTSPVIPPCQEITNIENACKPNGTSSLALIAHAECMCGGSYFEDWIGCLDCNYVHGARSPALTSAFHTIITSASNMLCTGTPTNSFQAIFASLNYVAASGSQSMSDLYPSQTAVSLYYTPTGPQGPGAITGSATAATESSSSGSGSSTTSAGGSGTTGGSKTSAAGTPGGIATADSTGTSSSSTSSSKAGAAPTGVWIGGPGLAAGMVGMAVL